MKEYGLELLFNIDDMDEGIKELQPLTENYESVHVALKREIENEYAETYKDYDKNILMMIEGLKNAKMEIRKRKADKARKENEEKDERIGQQKDRLKAEEKHFRERIGLGD